ncbi:unnamed protein product [Moneuplotes crassus]|uniref:WW domain-containing protein n=1 Tax=Euplotes crassus TaxID=5936 RepID=A0AAD1U2B3_EUPCR|nr:unnamed protein product [Moneuplotes crassus]
MKDDPITKVRVTGQWKYVQDIPEESERKLTGNVYVNHEFESWADNRPSRVMALKDQRKSYEHYKPKQNKEFTMMTMDGSNYVAPGSSQIYYGNFYEDWTEYALEDGRPYWHNADLGLSTWDDPMFILEVLKKNHIKNSIDMIPHYWKNIENTPFIELEMKNGQKLYIHRAFKRVFDKNPLMPEEEATNIKIKTEREKDLMQKVRESRLKRRQLKEKSKKEEPEPEVRLEEDPIHQQVEQPMDQPQPQFSLKPAKIHRPGDAQQPRDEEMKETAPQSHLNENVGERKEIKTEIINDDEDLNSSSDEDPNVPSAEDPNAPSDEDPNAPSEEDPNAPSEEDPNAPSEEDPNAPSDSELDPNAESEDELDPNAASSEEVSNKAENQPEPAQDSEEPTVMSMFERKKLQIQKSKETLAQYESIAIEFLELKRITPETDFDEFDDLVKAKLKGRVAMSRKQKEECFISAIKRFKNQKKDKIKQNFIDYVKRILPEVDVKETTAFKDYKEVLKGNCACHANPHIYKSVSKSKREKYFKEYVSNVLEEREKNNKVSLKQRLELLKKKEEKKKERDRRKLEEDDPKEARKRKLEEAVENYNEMLKEKVTDPDLDWEQAQKLIENDKRYRNEAIFPDKREKLWKSHRHFLFVEKREQKKNQRKNNH